MEKGEGYHWATKKPEVVRVEGLISSALKEPLPAWEYHPLNPTDSGST